MISWVTSVLPRIQRLEPDAMHVHSFIEPADELYFFYESQLQNCTSALNYRV
jgi:hypothetical protein